jgi:hypothetical protein
MTQEGMLFADEAKDIKREKSVHDVLYLPRRRHPSSHPSEVT